MAHFVVRAALVTLTVDLLTSNWVSGLPVTRATFPIIAGFVRLWFSSYFDERDRRRQTQSVQSIMGPCGFPRGRRILGFPRVGPIIKNANNR